MISDLYRTGWSYWLIAQAFGMEPAEVRQALATNGQSIVSDP
jgi:hypothetical protein